MSKRHQQQVELDIPEIPESASPIYSFVLFV